MILGHVRDYLPRVTLSLPGHRGPVAVEFVIDTGFDGGLALPSSLVAQLAASDAMDARCVWQTVLCADACTIRRVGMIEMDWDGETRAVEVMVLENNPLLGAVLLDGNLLQAEMTDGGEVSVEPLYLAILTAYSRGTCLLPTW